MRWISSSVLHGLDAPEIDPGNALRHKLTEIGEAQRVDVILTNPPFGGEEETSVPDNFLAAAYLVAAITY